MQKRVLGEKMVKKGRRVKKWKKGQKMDFGVSKYYITPIIRAFEWKNAHFSVKNPYFALKNPIFKGGGLFGENRLFYRFLMKKRPPYVIERPALTASFSGGMG